MYCVERDERINYIYIYEPQLVDYMTLITVLWTVESCNTQRRSAVASSAIGEILKVQGILS
jgi:hypothetical protein